MSIAARYASGLVGSGMLQDVMRGSGMRMHRPSRGLPI